MEQHIHLMNIKVVVLTNVHNITYWKSRTYKHDLSWHYTLMAGNFTCYIPLELDSPECQFIALMYAIQWDIGRPDTSSVEKK